MITISLTQYELQMAAIVGITRRICAIQRGQHGNATDRHREALRNWQDHIVGACGELAFAKYRKAYFPGGIGTHKTIPDVIDPSGGFEVRTRTEMTHDLSIRPHDRDGDIGVLVILDEKRPQDFHIIGHILIRDAKRDEWFKEQKLTNGETFPVYWVPQSALTQFVGDEKKSQ